LKSRGRLPSPLPHSNKPDVFETEGFIFTRPSLTHYIADRESLQYRGTRVLSGVADKVWRVRIDKQYLLGHLPKAHRDLSANHG
jgi:hypothetical protein